MVFLAQVVTGNENTYDVGPEGPGSAHYSAHGALLLPLADRVMSVCLRVELYGCVWKGESNT